MYFVHISDSGELKASRPIQQTRSIEKISGNISVFLAQYLISIYCSFQEAILLFIKMLRKMFGLQ